MNEPFYILFHGRFPSEKAAALFAAESAKSFARHRSVTILVPRRFGCARASAHITYRLPHDVRVMYLPTVDLFNIPLLGRIAFPLSYILFSFFCGLALLFLRRGIVDTNEPLPAFIATFLSRKVIIETHDFPERHRLFYKVLFKRVHTVLATNEWKRAELIKRFGISDGKICMERNGVDTELFGGKDKYACRKELDIPLSAQVAVYTGHLYSWKGVYTLGDAAKLIPDTLVIFVGGTSWNVQEFKNAYGTVDNIRIVGHVPHKQIPIWQGAADVLVLPNSAQEQISEKYTSPMKLFEYMASGRPIVASRVSSVQEVLDEDTSFLFEPDNAPALAKTLKTALSDAQSARKAIEAQHRALTYSWDARARRILSRFRLTS